MKKLVDNKKRHKPLSASEERRYNLWKTWTDGLNKRGRFGTAKMKNVGI
jgi:hypothetical protein